LIVSFNFDNMKNLYTTILFCGFAFLVFSQQIKQPNCVDMKGVLNENGTDYIPENYTGVAYNCTEGLVWEMYDCVDGVLHGSYKQWSFEGYLMKDAKYKNGIPDGLTVEWYPTGSRMEFNYNEGDIVDVKCFDKEGKEEDCP
jgi:antitoxin component YwqK of YwqJK toxin-antitoxin module